MMNSFKTDERLYYARNISLLWAQKEKQDSVSHRGMFPNTIFGKACNASSVNICSSGIIRTPFISFS